MQQLLCCCSKPKLEHDVQFISRPKPLYSFNQLPEDLVAQIIKKMDPLSFIRISRSAHWVFNVIQKNSKSIRIHLRDQLILQFLADDAKVMVKLISKLKSFKKIYDFDEVLDSLVHCSYFCLRSIWFSASCFDDDFFFLTLHHIQRHKMRCISLSLPNNEHLDFSIDTFHPKEVAIVGEESLCLDYISSDSLKKIESIQFDCKTSKELDTIQDKIFEHCKNVKLFISDLGDVQQGILRLIENIQHSEVLINYLTIEYNLQYNRLFKLSEMMSGFTFLDYEIKFIKWVQTVLCFPIHKEKGKHLVVTTKLDKKIIFSSQQYETISMSIICCTEEFVEFLAKTNGLKANDIASNVDVVKIGKEIFGTRDDE